MWENCHDYDPAVEAQVGKPKPSENVDLARLDALFAAATKHYAIGVNRLTANRDKALEWAESTYNAYPAIAAELRTLRARVAELEAEAEDEGECLNDVTLDFIDLKAECDRLRAELAEMREDDMAEIEDLRRERSELLAERDRLRAELAEARRDGERLSHIIEQSNNGRGWLQDDVWDQAADLWYQQDDEEDVQKWVRAVIDKDIAAWGGAK